MITIKSLRLTLFVIALFLSVVTGYAQVGINTETPTTALDINGDLRIQNVPISTSTDDEILVIDTSGVVKRSIISNSFFRGYLASDFATETTRMIYKIGPFNVIDEPNGDFDEQNNFFIPSVSGLYNVVITVTTTAIDSIPGNNVVYGLVDSATDKWILRFSVPKLYIQNVGLNSQAGVTNSFSGAVMLTKGEKYYFGVTDRVRLLSEPSGSTGKGIGTYFSVDLIKTI